MKSTVIANLERLLTQGTTFSIATFSAYSRGHYTTIVSSGTIEGAVPARVRRSLPVIRLNALDRCLVRQQQFARVAAARALNTAMAVPATNFANSEIMASLSHLSELVRTTPTSNRIVIVASDLLEHSSAASFYFRRNFRIIDPSREMRNAERRGLIANFGDARIFVIGTGLLPQGRGNVVRDVDAVNALVNFWTTWFSRSRARSVVIGKPNLVTPIQ